MSGTTSAKQRGPELARGESPAPERPSRTSHAAATYLDHYLRWAPGMPHNDAARAAAAMSVYVRRLDLRQGATHGVAEADSRRLRAAECLEAVVAAGLERREGTFLLPPALPAPDLADVYIAWRLISLQLLLVGVPLWPDSVSAKTRVLCVCTGCTQVFRPKRSPARYCSMCKDKKHAPPRATGAPPQFRDWPAVVGLVGGGLEPGDSTPVIAPRTFGPAVMGYGRRNVAACAECGEVFFAQSGAACCSECSSRVASREHRNRMRGAPRRKPQTS